MNPTIPAGRYVVQGDRYLVRIPKGHEDDVQTALEEARKSHVEHMSDGRAYLSIPLDGNRSPVSPALESLARVRVPAMMVEEANTLAPTKVLHPRVQRRRRAVRATKKTAKRSH